VALCSTCGTSLAAIEPSQPASPFAAEARYAMGEADLAEFTLHRQGQRLGAGLLGLGLCLALAAAAVILLPRMQPQPTDRPPLPTAIPMRLAGPSVTPGPPSATSVPSPTATATAMPRATAAPCQQALRAGDTLIRILARCGYQDLSIMPTVMALNGIADETRLQVGQVIAVPLPTVTIDPAASPQPSVAAPESPGSAELTRLAFDPFSPTLTPTLLPGLAWHIIQPDENMIALVLQHDTDLKTLADLNPEIAFPLCDFSERFGGPECTVQLSIRQSVRVPGPTPVSQPLIESSPRPSPLPSPTFNAAVAQSPADQSFFSNQDQVTLRWVGTGQLQPDAVYRVQLENTDSGARFHMDTREQFFIIPASWQGDARNSQHYRWHIEVLDRNSSAVLHASEPLRFVWQGRGTGA